MNDERKTDYDAIVVGSGIGGLSCACFLALDGEKVLLVERDENLGGCMQPVEEGPWKWNLGLQWICKFGKFDPDGLMMHHITEGKVTFNKLDDAFQDMVFASHDNYRFTPISDMDKNEDALIEAFPEEKDKIKKYYSWVRDVNHKVLSIPIGKIFPLHNAQKKYNKLLHVMFPFLPKAIGGPLTTTSVATVVEETLGIENPILKDILYSYWHLFGMPPRETPFLFYAVVVGLQEGGVYYPQGGAESIIDSAMETLMGHGGEIRWSTPVEQIWVEDGVAKGVFIKGQTKPITAKNVVSSIGIKETIERLLPPSAQTNEHVQRTLGIVSTELDAIPSILLLRLGFKGNLTKFGIRNKTYRYVKGTPWDMKADPRDPNWTPPDVTINFPSLYDTGHIGPGYHTGEVVALTDYKYFKQYDPASEEYAVLIARLTDAMGAKMEAFFPGILKYCEYTLLTTPLDVIKYTGHERGSIYGLDIRKAANMEVQVHSGIDHLYYSGEDVFAQGITLTNGVLAASGVLGWGLIKQFF